MRSQRRPIRKFRSLILCAKLIEEHVHIDTMVMIIENACYQVHMQYA